MSEVTETSILKAGLPTPLLLLSQLVTACPGHRAVGSSARLSGLSRSDFVHWPKADGLTMRPDRPVIGGRAAEMAWTQDFCH